MPHSIPPEKLTEISEALFHGRKIEAIKLYRELTGLGLREAKDAVEELEASLRASHRKSLLQSRKAAAAASWPQP